MTETNLWMLAAAVVAITCACYSKRSYRLAEQHLKHLQQDKTALRKRCEDAGLFRADLVEFTLNRWQTGRAGGHVLDDGVTGRVYDQMAMAFDRIMHGTPFTYPEDLEHGSDVILDLTMVDQGIYQQRSGVERRRGFTTPVLSARDPEHFRRSGDDRRQS